MNDSDFWFIPLSCFAFAGIYWTLGHVAATLHRIEEKLRKRP